MNEPNFFIIIFKNNKKRKILKSFVSKFKAEDYFLRKIKESNNVKFPISYENGLFCEYKIALVSKEWDQDQIYYSDEIGRNIIVNPKIDDNLYINKLSLYKKEEKIYDVGKNVKLTLNELVRTYLNKNKIYMISKINNKFVIQDDDEYYLFSLKNESDCDRFLDLLPYHLDKINIIVVKDFSSPQKKYLYGILTEKGFSKDFLYRNTTTHPK